MDALEESGAKADVWQSSTDIVGYRGDLQRNLDWIRRRAQETEQFAVLSDAANGFVAGGCLPQGGWLEPRHYPPFPCPGLVDSTGAGDTFRAGMLLGFGEGWPLSDCLRFASAAGCLNCARWTASGNLPSRQEIEAHIAASPAVADAY
jgi:sugar/nucleoside kinase (ribokinase family)